MSHPPLRAVFLDLDDTLLDTAGILLGPARAEAGLAMVAAGLPGTAEEAAAALERIAREKPGGNPCEKLAEEKGVDPIRVGFAGWNAFHCRAIPESLPLLDGVAEGIRSLRSRGLLLFLVTFGEVATQEAKVRATKMATLVDAVVYEPLSTSSDKGRAFRALCGERGLSAAECAAVGDRPDAEIAAAKRLGMRSIRIRRGEHRWLEPAGPMETADATVESFRDAVPHLLVWAPKKRHA